MSRRIFDVMQRGAEALLTAVIMFVSLVLFRPIAFARRRYWLR